LARTDSDGCTSVKDSTPSPTPTITIFLRKRWRRILTIGAALLVVNAWAWGLCRNEVLAVAYSYPDGGGYSRIKDSGVSETIKHKGSVILPQSDRGCYCCGFTFQVAMRVAQRRGLLNARTVDQVRRFQKQWYGSEKGSEFKECAMAVTELGIGQEINLADAKPGDFMIFFTTRGQGHSVVFLDWARGARGEVIGIQYRSSQMETGGISDCVQYFSDAQPLAGDIDRNQVAVARLNRRWWSRLLYPL
jgi:hypothetical protein